MSKKFLNLKCSFFVLVNGRYTHWSEWGMCDQACGVGNQTRMRNCSDPAPLNGGKPCDGDSVEIKHCKIKECAGKISCNTPSDLQIHL